MTLYPVALPLQHEFTIARGSIREQRALIVELSHDGLSGYGEVTENVYYGRSLESIAANLMAARQRIEAYVYGTPEVFWEQLQSMWDGDSFAQCALDLAAHDLYGRLQGRSLIDLWQLAAAPLVESSYTIGIDTVDVMRSKLREMPGWGCYKIKLGTSRDMEIVRALRAETDATFRVDANCGWSADETIANAHALVELGVEFIEQPLPPTADDADQERVFRESVLPVMADESCQVASDVAACVGRFHGVNVKLCKCGGLTPALRMLRQARQLGLRTMVGCMVESSIGISAAAQLLPLLDYADLDGAVLLRDEPAEGVRVERGRVQWTGEAGTGARLKKERLPEFRAHMGGDLG